MVYENKVLNLRVCVSVCRLPDSCSTFAQQTSLLHSMTLTQLFNLTRALILPCARAQTGNSASSSTARQFSVLPFSRWSHCLLQVILAFDPDSSRGVIVRNTSGPALAVYEMDVTSGCGGTDCWWEACILCSGRAVGVPGTHGQTGESSNVVAEPKAINHNK